MSVDCSAIVVDISAVLVYIDSRDFRAQRFEYLRRYSTGRSVGTVKQYFHTCQVHAFFYQKVGVLLFSIGIFVTLSLFSYATILAEIRFYEFFYVFAYFVSISVKYFYTVVLRRIVRCAYHYAEIATVLFGEICHACRRHNSHVHRVSSRRKQSFYKCSGQIHA